MKDYFYIKFTVKALNTERLINKLKSVLVLDVKKQGKYLSFSVKPRDKMQIVDILTQSLYNDFKIEEKTPKRLISENIEKIVAILVFFVISLLPMFFIFDAEVFCEDQTLKRLVEQKISAYENTLTNIKDIDEESIQISILSMDNVSFAEVKRIGGKLYVYCMREIESVKEDALFELKSKADGVVTKIIILSGRAKVKVGDQVKTGDILIDGSIFSEKTGKSEKVKAIGDVYGVQKIVKTVTINKASLDKIETGRTKNIKGVKFLNYEWIKEAPYEYYTVIKKEEYLSKNFFLPIKIVSMEYLELSCEIKDVDLDLEIKKLAEEEKSNVIEIEAKILSQNIEVIENPNSYEVTCVTKVERKFN